MSILNDKTWSLFLQTHKPLVTHIVFVNTYLEYKYLLNK
jgi:hypothetical protein